MLGEVWELKSLMASRAAAGQSVWTGAHLTSRHSPGRLTCLFNEESHKNIRQRHAGSLLLWEVRPTAVTLVPCLVPGAPRAEVCDSINAVATTCVCCYSMMGFFGATLKDVAFSNFPGSPSCLLAFVGTSPVTRFVLKTADGQHWTVGKNCH